MMLYELYDVDNLVLELSSQTLVSVVEVINIKHALAKRISCEIYTP